MNKLVVILALMPSLCFGQWAQVGNAINGQNAGDSFGYSTAISADGTIVAVGANANDGGGSSSGQVRVFGLNNNIWSQIGADINGETGGDQTGQAVSLSADGTILAIGEPFNNDLGYTAGQVRVFRNVNNSWTQIGQDLYGENSSAEGGKSVDLSADGSVLAFGIPNNTVNGVFFAGKVKVFVNQNNNWVQKGGDINGDGSIIKFGSGVSLSDDGNIIAIGQSGDPTNSNPEDTGRVKIYQFVNNQWTQLGNTIFEPGSRGEFGLRVSLSSSGTILAIGSFGRSEVQVFELNNGVWSQIGSTLIGNGAGDSFGYSVSLSSNGERLAVGARFVNLNNNQPGKVYIFERKDNNWALIHNPIEGVALGDQTGFSVAINQDGTKVAVGAINNDSVGSNAGQVRVFESISTVNIATIEHNHWLILYPNPASETIKIQSSENILSFKVLTMEGKTVQQKEGINLSELAIDMRELVSGMYILTLQTPTKLESRRIMKN